MELPAHKSTPERLYEYSTLPSPKHTRLLELEPAEGTNAELRYRIHPINLYDIETPFYDAISYTWGGEIFPRTLWVDDAESRPGRLLITVNLFDALCRFRRRGIPRFLWADAICINHKADAEKSTHIQLMTNIYTGASSVLVWLGHFGEEEQAVACINLLRRTRVLPTANQSRKQELEILVESLLQLPWFSRRWIIQEVVMNSNVTLYCGLQKISFMSLCLVTNSIGIRSERPSRRIKALNTMFDLWKHWSL